MSCRCSIDFHGYSFPLWVLHASLTVLNSPLLSRHISYKIGVAVLATPCLPPPPLSIVLPIATPNTA